LQRAGLENFSYKNEETETKGTLLVPVLLYNNNIISRFDRPNKFYLTCICLKQDHRKVGCHQ